MTFNGLINPYLTFPSQLPDLPARQHTDAGDPTYVVRAALVSQTAQGVTLAGTTATGETLHLAISVPAPGVARVLLHDGQPDPRRVQLARVAAALAPAVTIETSSKQIVLAAEGVRVEIHLDPFQMTFLGPDGSPTLLQDTSTTIVTDRLATLPLGFSRVDGQRVAFHDSFAVEPDEHFYGFGEKFTDFDKRGQQLEMWLWDAFGVHGERAYKNVPFFISSRGYGVFVDSTTAIRYDMAASNHALFSMIVPDSALDYYVIMGPDPKTIITRYAGLVSFPTLPPKWSLGLWMSFGFVKDTAADILEHARAVREHHIPCDVVHIDCYWMPLGRWSDMIWDPQTFPDPDAMIQELKALDFNICLWMNSYIGIESPRFAEGCEKGYFLKMPDGKVWTDDLWSGLHPPVAIIDLTHPDAVTWFKDSLRPLLRQGIDAFKTDFGEAVPFEVVAYNGMTGAELHNLYPLLYNDAVTETIREETGRAPLVWGRSTYAGGQRHAAMWGGDPNCSYSALASTLRGGLSFGMCGHAFWGHDLGGFHVTPTPDLYVRWSQFGLFSPMSRAHGMSSRLPWLFGDEAERIFTDYVRLRYRLLPYLYTYARIAAATSLPILRPMVLEFPDDPLTYTMDLQYMFGQDLLVAPLYNPSGKRPIYFPAGRWVDFWTNEVIDGPTTRFVEAPLDTLPLYVRANALIPTIEPPQHLTEDPFEQVTFEGYVLDAGQTVMDDIDGMTRVSVTLDGSRAEITVLSPKAQVSVHLLPLGGAPIESVIVNGQPYVRRDDSPAWTAGLKGWQREADGGTRIWL
jgi:alpha-D-xyloside xylohydrolase